MWFPQHCTLYKTCPVNLNVLKGFGHHVASNAGLHAEPHRCLPVSYPGPKQVKDAGFFRL